MKKLLMTASAALAAVTLFSVPACALKILTGDSFTKTSKSEWVEDRYEPEEFDRSNNRLYISVGKNGYRKNRPADMQDKQYDYQGKKLACEKTTSNTWTVSVKINVDDTWFGSDNGRKRAELRVDLVDGAGNPVSHSPAIAMIKAGNNSPALNYYNPKIKNSWGTASRYIDADKESQSLDVEQDWHTLRILCSKGTITYYVDDKKIGNCTLDTEDVYPAFMALNVTNYGRSDVVEFDDCYLYDGSYVIKQLTQEQKEEKEDKKASQYEKKRSSWIAKYTDKNGSLTKEMPEKYWDY